MEIEKIKRLIQASALTFQRDSGEITGRDWTEPLEVEVYRDYKPDRFNTCQITKAYMSLYYGEQYKNVMVAKGKNLDMRISLVEGEVVEIWGRNEIYSPNKTKNRMFSETVNPNPGETIGDVIRAFSATDSFEEMRKNCHYHNCFAVINEQESSVIISGIGMYS